MMFLMVMRRRRRRITMTMTTMMMTTMMMATTTAVSLLFLFTTSIITISACFMFLSNYYFIFAVNATNTVVLTIIRILSNIIDDIVYLCVGSSHFGLVGFADFMVVTSIAIFTVFISATFATA